jgi:hypothetical protein
MMWTIDRSLMEQNQQIYKIWDHSKPVLGDGSSCNKVK